MTPIEFSLQGWAAKKIAFSSIAALTITVAATAKTMTRSAGSWITDDVEVGDKLTFTGFAAGGNNGTFEVTEMTATVLTLGNATGLVDVTNDTPIAAHIGDRLVHAGPSLLGGIRVITVGDDVTPHDSAVALWDAVDSTADLDIGCTPLRCNTSLRVACTTPAEAWVLYKRA